jgi:hypothetical protein
MRTISAMQKYPARAIAVGARWVNKAPRKQLAKLKVGVVASHF